MYICICNSVTDSQIRAQRAPAQCSVAAFYRAMGIQPKCGKCVPLIRQILESDASASGVPAADAADSCCP